MRGLIVGYVAEVREAPMLGLMQQRPLLISSLLDYAERYHAGTEIVSCTASA